MDRPVAGESTRSSSRNERLIIYALPDVRAQIDDDVVAALRALKPHAGRLVVVTTGVLEVGARQRLAELADGVEHHPARSFTRSLYRAPVTAAVSQGNVGEVVLTGASWFAPREVTRETLSGVFAAMESDPADLWEIVEQTHSTVRDFTPQGFPLTEEPYLWVALRGVALSSEVWSAADASPITPRAAAAGISTGAMFTATRMGSPDAALLQVPRLIAEGIPVLPRRPFLQYPPFLEQHAVIGREILDAAARAGFDRDRVLAALARTLPPKALSTNLGMLEIVGGPGKSVNEASGRALRILVLLHVTDVAAGSEALQRLSVLPAGFHLVVTTTDGSRAARLERLILEMLAGHVALSEVRVAPANRGNDMSALFIACRDVLLSRNYDILLRLRCRAMSSKTRVVRHYFLRYQFENLLGSQAQVAEILAMFAREPGLGMVFPPMIHIGFQTLGRGWGSVRSGGERVARRLGLHVPLDRVSPLAPFGGMFFARLEAIESMTREKWTYRDYSSAGDRLYGNLAHVQVRMLTAVAAERGYHSRTILTPEHAAISHTALEFKADEISATTSGYPVDRIALLHRAGPTGRGGLVGLSRMYLRLKHPRVARVVLPVMAVAERGFTSVKSRAATYRSLVGGWRRRDAER